MSVVKFLNIGKKELYPLCRSLTGEGTLKTLKIIKKNFTSLKIKNIKCGSKVFDWTVPKQWEIKSATVKDKLGNTIIDFANNNLHLVGYSIRFKKKINFEQLLKHIHTLPKQSNAIPYITSYYKDYWGFCITDNQKKEMLKNYNLNDSFFVNIDSHFKKKGKLNYGELIIKGKSKQEILISTYICHPSLANNELSGPIVSMSLIEHFKKKKNLKTLRFIFIPETIGSIIYISRNLKYLKENICGGYVLTCIGDDRQHSCMLSKYENSPSDKSLLESYKFNKIRFKKYSFLKRGSDERQFNSPGIDLPMTSIFRTKYGEYPEYHTSLDNFDSVVNKEGLKGGFKISKDAIGILQEKILPKNIILCEPQLSKRGLYPTMSKKDNKDKNASKKIMDFLQYSDGRNDLWDISRLIKLNYKKTEKIYKLLKKSNIISS
jgi:aminopeptidase-like protein